MYKDTPLGSQRVQFYFTYAPQCIIIIILAYTCLFFSPQYPKRETDCSLVRYTAMYKISTVKP